MFQQQFGRMANPMNQIMDAFPQIQSMNAQMPHMMQGQTPYQFTGHPMHQNPMQMMQMNQASHVQNNIPMNNQQNPQMNQQNQQLHQVPNIIPNFPPGTPFPMGFPPNNSKNPLQPQLSQNKKRITKNQNLKQMQPIPIQHPQQTKIPNQNICFFKKLFFKN